MTSKWIWPFELLDKLGEGGMGVVYRARYVGNNRIVAVKLLPDDVAQNPTLVARFDRELEILTQLRHKNIVHCFGGATESKQRFYAMELVEGGTLGEALRSKGKFTWDHVVEFGAQMCAALQYAHERGVIHRDVKPGNFLITKNGQLKLSDFGLATIVAGQRITMQGKTAGTFLYMAPEQIRGKPPLSNRTDLYALGCVLFELLTGHPPFDASTPAEVLHKHLKETPPRVASIVLDCPAELDKLVSDLLQKDPAARPASAAEVEYRLATILRPSLVQHVDVMARTPTANVAAVVATPSDDDQEYASAPPPTTPARIAPALPIVVVVSLILAAWGWSAAWSAQRKLQEMTEIWVQAAVTPGPLQISALEQLGKLPDLTEPQIARVLEVVTSPAEAPVRVAAVQCLTKHAAACRSHLHQFVSLERHEAELSVRTEIVQMRQAVESAPANGRRSLTGWFIWATVFAVIGFASWRGWKFVQKQLPPIK